MNKRCDYQGRAYAGSQLQVQIYVNRRSQELSQGVLSALPSLAEMGARLKWVSPLEQKGFAEHQDLAFLKAIGLEHYYPALKEFWPRRGPVWDALAAVELRSGARGVVLVEGKSYPGEVYGGGCQACPRSRERIQRALDQTKRRLGVSSAANWTGPLYQSANRLAHLYFFREVVNVPAWLVGLYFLNDPHSPATREDWKVALSDVKAELGLVPGGVPDVVELFLETRGRSELTAPKN
jgi:hypothetical protein